MKTSSIPPIPSLLAGGFPGSVASAELLPRDIFHQGVRGEGIIPLRDGFLVEAEEIQAEGFMFARFGAKETVPVAVRGIERIFDAGRTTNGALFLGIGDKKLRPSRQITLHRPSNNLPSLER